MNSNYGQAVERRRVFVSYHHRGDQAYYDEFSSSFHDRYEAITDNSIERRIDSSDFGYIMRCIRENHLKGSSCTVVLCGRETPKRRYVDWEIEASLQQQMGLVAVLLPTIERFPNGGTAKPDRLQDNIDSGYSVWVWWHALLANPEQLPLLVEAANGKSKRLILNNRQRMSRNG
ncbi:TIR domain-containing protein [Bradyrhizobium japonicum]|uniref:TIR domain-containing protein n=1 Tax=Bradyrhizobium japonicum TaxID=375 RepID=UPI001BAD2150|nr:TIR domain-containing protein [Bradyrhizobium japonicum]MBR0911481.1 TIR domain-containing protein [Bradyrhizobium japonicum]